MKGTLPWMLVLAMCASHYPEYAYIFVIVAGALLFIDETYRKRKDMKKFWLNTAFESVFIKLFKLKK